MNDAEDQEQQDHETRHADEPEQQWDHPWPPFTAADCARPTLSAMRMARPGGLASN
jgi:hypothetical protein